MADITETSTVRKTSILEAAEGIFIRFGFKKTSMDDIARAVGISRQGLYLHFPTKDALFIGMVAHTIETKRRAVREVLAVDTLDIENRLLRAFEAIDGKVIGTENLYELLATTAELVGPVVRELYEAVVSDVARALKTTGVAAQWKHTGLSAKDLAEHLSAVSYGIKHKARTAAEYRIRMRVAIGIICLQQQLCRGRGRIT